MADEVTHVGIGDYWLEKLSEEQPWRKEPRRRAPSRSSSGHRDGPSDGACSTWAQPTKQNWRKPTAGCTPRHAPAVTTYPRVSQLAYVIDQDTLHQLLRGAAASARRTRSTTSTSPTVSTASNPRAASTATSARRSARCTASLTIQSLVPDAENTWRQAKDARGVGERPPNAESGHPRATPSCKS